MTGRSEQERARRGFLADAAAGFADPTPQPQPAAVSSDWLPRPRDGVRALPCGQWFDAVRLPTFDGIRAVALLKNESGPVIEDRSLGVMTWLVPAGATADWTLPGVDALGVGRVLMVPPATQVHGDGARWLIPPPVGGDCLTDPQVLYDALAKTCGSAGGEANGDA